MFQHAVTLNPEPQVIIKNNNNGNNNNSNNNNSNNNNNDKFELSTSAPNKPSSNGVVAQWGPSPEKEKKGQDRFQCSQASVVIGSLNP